MAHSVQRRRGASAPSREAEEGGSALPLADDSVETAIRCVNPSPAKPPSRSKDTDSMPTVSGSVLRSPEREENGDSDNRDLVTQLGSPSLLTRTPSPPRRVPGRHLRRAMSTSLLNLPTFFNPRAASLREMSVSRPPGTPFEPSFFYGDGNVTSHTPKSTLHPATKSSPSRITSTDQKRTAKRAGKKTRTTPHRDQVRAALTKRTFGLATATKMMSAAKNAVSEVVAGVKERKKVGRKRPRYSEASARSVDAKEEAALAAVAAVTSAADSTSSPTDEKTPRAGPSSSSARIRSSKSLKGSSSPHTVGYSSHRKRSRRFASSYASLAASTGARSRLDPAAAAGDSYLLSSSVLNRKRPISKSEQCLALTESLRGVYRSPIRSGGDGDDWVDEPDFAFGHRQGTEVLSSPVPPFSSPSFEATRPLFTRSLAPSPASTRSRRKHDPEMFSPAVSSVWPCDTNETVSSPPFWLSSYDSGVRLTVDFDESIMVLSTARRPRKSASSPDSLVRAYRAVEHELELDLGPAGPARGEIFRNQSPSARYDAQARVRGSRVDASETSGVVKPYAIAEPYNLDLELGLNVEDFETVEDGKGFGRNISSDECPFPLDHLGRMIPPCGVSIATAIEATDVASATGSRRSEDDSKRIPLDEFGETHAIGPARSRPLSMSSDSYSIGADPGLSLSTVNRGGRPFRPLPPLPLGSASASSVPGKAFAPTPPLKIGSRSRTSTAESASTTSASASSSSQSQRGQADSSRDLDSADLASAQVVDARRLSLEPVLTGSLMALRRSSTSTGGTATAPVSPSLSTGNSPSGYQTFSLSPRTLSYAPHSPAEAESEAAIVRSESDSTDSLTPKPSSTCRIPDSSPMSPFRVDFGHSPDSDSTFSAAAEPKADSEEPQEPGASMANLALLKSADFPLESETASAVVRQAARYVFPGPRSPLQSAHSASSMGSSSAADQGVPDLRRTIRPGRDSTRYGASQVYQDDIPATDTQSGDLAEGRTVDDHGVLVERNEATTLRRKGAVMHRPAAGRARSSSPNKEN